MNNSMLSDEGSRREALDMRYSFLVQAPAGSGKTELLLQRFLAGLAIVGAPEEVVAITFTQKAAKEMQARIAGAINLAVNNELSAFKMEKTRDLALAVVEHGRALEWDLGDLHSRLNIQTIDGLAHMIAHRAPLLSGLCGQSKIVDYPQYRYRKAIINVIEKLHCDARFSKNLDVLLGLFRNNLERLIDVCCDMLSKRDQWLRHSASLIHSNHDLAENLKLIIDKEVEGFAASLGPDLLQSCFDFLSQFSEADILDAFPNIGSDGFTSGLTDASTAQALIGILFTDKMTPRARLPTTLSAAVKEMDKDTAKSIKEQFSSISSALNPAMARSATLIRELPDYEQFDQETIVALNEIMILAVSELSTIFDKNNEIDFVGVTQAAISALDTEHGIEDIALYLDYRIQHLLIDEFQDTSVSHFTLIQNLVSSWTVNDGKTLFLVGDPMQSIYRFRQAEVGLLLHVKRNGIGPVSPKFIRLSSNFRSSASLVTWYNDTFSHIFPAVECSESGAVPYSPATPAISADHDADECVAYWTRFSDSQSQARSIIDEIQHISQHNLGTVGVLARTKNSLAPFLSASKHAGLDVCANGVLSLSVVSPAKELLAVSNVLIHPESAYYWTLLLGSTIGGLSNDDIAALEVDSNAHFGEWNNRANRLQDGAKYRFVRIYAAIEDTLRVLQQFGLGKALNHFWRIMQLEKLFIDSDHAVIAQYFFNAIAVWERHDGARDGQLLESILDETYLPGATDAPITAMTIHKSKGLEFDFVFVLDLDKPLRSSDVSVIRWLETPVSGSIDTFIAGTYRQSNKAKTAYSYIGFLERERLALEYDRLFYVAATRAKKKLFLCGARGKGSLPKNSLIGALSDTIDRFDATPAGTHTEASHHWDRKRVSKNWLADYPLVTFEHPPLCGELDISFLLHDSKRRAETDISHQLIRTALETKVFPSQSRDISALVHSMGCSDLFNDEDFDRLLALASGFGSLPVVSQLLTEPDWSLYASFDLNGQRGAPALCHAYHKQRLEWVHFTADDEMSAPDFVHHLPLRRALFSNEKPVSLTIVNIRTHKIRTETVY